MSCAVPTREPACQPACSSEKGMTLVEVLVALAVVAITLSAGFKASGALTVNAQRLADLTVTHWCAENQLTQLRLSKAWPGLGDSDFTCVQLGRELKGEQHVGTTLNSNFRRVDVQIFDEQDRPIVRLATVISRF